MADGRGDQEFRVPQVQFGTYTGIMAQPLVPQQPVPQFGGAAGISYLINQFLGGVREARLRNLAIQEQRKQDALNALLAVSEMVASSPILTPEAKQRAAQTVAEAIASSVMGEVRQAGRSKAGRGVANFLKELAIGMAGGRMPEPATKAEDFQRRAGELITEIFSNPQYYKPAIVEQLNQQLHSRINELTAGRQYVFQEDVLSDPTVASIIGQLQTLQADIHPAVSTIIKQLPSRQQATLESVMERRLVEQVVSAPPTGAAAPGAGVVQPLPPPPAAETRPQAAPPTAAPPPPDRVPQGTAPAPGITAHQQPQPPQPLDVRELVTVAVKPGAPGAPGAGGESVAVNYRDLREATHGLGQQTLDDTAIYYLNRMRVNTAPVTRWFFDGRRLYRGEVIEVPGTVIQLPGMRIEPGLYEAYTRRKIDDLTLRPLSSEPTLTRRETAEGPEVILSFDGQQHTFKLPYRLELGRPETERRLTALAQNRVRLLDQVRDDINRIATETRNAIEQVRRNVLQQYPGIDPSKAPTVQAQLDNAVRSEAGRGITRMLQVIRSFAEQNFILAEEAQRLLERVPLTDADARRQLQLFSRQPKMQDIIDEYIMPQIDVISGDDQRVRESLIMKLLETPTEFYWPVRGVEQGGRVGMAPPEVTTLPGRDQVAKLESRRQKLRSSLAPTSDPIEAAFSVIKEAEGFSPTPYPDIGRLSIGYGTEALPTDTRITEEEAERRSKLHIRRDFDILSDAIRVPLSPSQWAAILSLAYNVGVNAVLRSGIVDAINSGDLDGAARIMERMCYVAGQYDPAIHVRRLAEIDLLLSGRQGAPEQRAEASQQAATATQPEKKRPSPMPPAASTPQASARRSSYDTVFLQTDWLR